MRPNAPVRSVAAVTRSSHLFEVVDFPERIGVAFGFEVYVGVAVDVGEVIDEACESYVGLDLGTRFSGPDHVAAVDFMLGEDDVAVAVVEVEGHGVGLEVEWC